MANGQKHIGDDFDYNREDLGFDGEAGSENGADQTEERFDELRELFVELGEEYLNPTKRAKALAEMSHGEKEVMSWMGQTMQGAKRVTRALTGGLRARTNAITERVVGLRPFGDEDQARYVAGRSLMQDTLSDDAPLREDIRHTANVLLREYITKFVIIDGVRKPVKHTLLDILTNPAIEVKSSVGNDEPAIATKEELGAILIHEFLHPLRAAVAKMAKTALRSERGLKDLSLPPDDLLKMSAPNARFAAAVALLNGLVSGVTTTVQIKGVSDYLMNNPGTGAKQASSMAIAVILGFMFGNEAYHSRQQVLIGATKSYQPMDYETEPPTPGDSRMTRIKKGLQSVAKSGEQNLFGSPAMKWVLRKVKAEKLNPMIQGETKARVIAGVSVASLLMTALSVVSTVNTYYGSKRRAGQLKAESTQYVNDYEKALNAARDKVRAKTEQIALEEKDVGTVVADAAGRTTRVSPEGPGPLFKFKTDEGGKLKADVEGLTSRTTEQIRGKFAKAQASVGTEASLGNTVTDSQAAIEARMDAAMSQFVREVNTEVMGRYEQELTELISRYVDAINDAEKRLYPEGNKKRTERFNVNVERKVKAPDAGRLFGLPTTPFWETIGNSFEHFGPAAMLLILLAIYIGYLGEGGVELEGIPNHRKRLLRYLGRKLNRPEMGMDDPDAPVKFGEGLAHETHKLRNDTKAFAAAMNRWVGALADQVVHVLENSQQWSHLNGIKSEELAAIIAGILDNSAKYPSLTDQVFSAWIHEGDVESAMVMGKKVRGMMGSPDKLIAILDSGTAFDCIMRVLEEAGNDQSVYTDDAMALAIAIGRRADLTVGEKEKLFDKLVANCRKPEVLISMEEQWMTPSTGEVLGADPKSGGLLTRGPKGEYRAHVPSRREPVRVEEGKSTELEEGLEEGEEEKEGRNKVVGNDPYGRTGNPNAEKPRRYAASVAEANKLYYQLMEAHDDEVDDAEAVAAYERLVRGPLNSAASGQTQQEFLDELVASNEPRWIDTDRAWTMLNELMDGVETMSQSAPTPQKPQQTKPPVGEPVFYYGAEEEKRQEEQEELVEKLKQVRGKQPAPKALPATPEARVDRPQPHTTLSATDIDNLPPKRRKDAMQIILGYPGRIGHTQQAYEIFSRLWRTDEQFQVAAINEAWTHYGKNLGIEKKAGLISAGAKWLWKGEVDRGHDATDKEIAEAIERMLSRVRQDLASQG